jgi:hypothetical protein
MDIQINLRRGDFEAMHPTAKLLNFDAEKMVYFGDKSESINSQWSTWCACIGMQYFEVEEAQKVAVPEWINVNLLSPQIDTKVLICVGDDVEVAFYRDFEGCGYFEDYQDCVYWMPLPETMIEAQEQVG